MTMGGALGALGKVTTDRIGDFGEFLNPFDGGNGHPDGFDDWLAELYAYVETINQANDTSLKVVASTNELIAIFESTGDGLGPPVANALVTIGENGWVSGLTEPGDAERQGVNTVPEGVDPYTFFQNNIADPESELTFDRTNGIANVRDGSNVWTYQLTKDGWQVVAKNGEAIFDSKDSKSGGSGGAAAAQRATEFAQTHQLALDKLAQDAEQFNQALGEQIREHIIDTETTRRRDLGNLAVQMGQLSLQQQEMIQEILREPSDFLARAFLSRGEQSPFGFVSQADLINALKDEFGRIADFTDEQANSLATALAPVLPTSGVAGSSGTGGGVPSLSGALTSPSGGGGVSIPSLSNAVQENQILHGTLTPTTQDLAAHAAEGNANAGVVAGGGGNHIVFSQDGRVIGGTQVTVGEDIPPAPDPTVSVGQSGGNNAILGDTPDTIAGAPDPFAFAAGSPGFIRLSQFVAGDSQRGLGNTGELVLNPLNAPIAVVNNQQTKELLRAGIPRFADGTLQTSDPLNLQSLFQSGVQNINDVGGLEQLTLQASNDLNVSPQTLEATPTNTQVTPQTLEGTNTATADIPSLSQASVSPSITSVLPPQPAPTATATPFNNKTNPNISVGPGDSLAQLDQIGVPNFTVDDLRNDPRWTGEVQGTLRAMFPDMGHNELILMAIRAQNPGMDTNQIVAANPALASSFGLGREVIEQAASQAGLPLPGFATTLPTSEQQAALAAGDFQKYLDLRNSETGIQPGTAGSTTGGSAFSRLSSALGLTGGSPLTQEEILSTAIQSQPPAVRDLLAGNQVAPFRLASAVTGQQIPFFSPTQLAQLTKDEISALRTRLAAENISLDDVVQMMSLIYGGNPAQSTGQRVRGR